MSIAAPASSPLIGNYQTPGGYTAAEISATVADADFIIWLLETWQAAIVAFAQSATAYVTLIMFGPLATAISALPPFTGNPSSTTGGPTPPATVPPGALLRIFAFIKNLKTRGFYTEAIGQDLGVIGAAGAALDLENAKPVISAVRRGDEVRVKWVKGDFDGQEFWVDRGDGNFVKLAVDTRPDYFDTEPLPATAKTWRYKSRYILDDAPVGLFSDVIEFLAKQ